MRCLRYGAKDKADRRAFRKLIDKYRDDLYNAGKGGHYYDGKMFIQDEKKENCIFGCIVCIVGCNVHLLHRMRCGRI